MRFWPSVIVVRNLDADKSTKYYEEVLRLLNEITGLLKENNTILKQNNKTVEELNERVRKIGFNTSNLKWSACDKICLTVQSDHCETDLDWLLLFSCALSIFIGPGTLSNNIQRSSALFMIVILWPSAPAYNCIILRNFTFTMSACAILLYSYQFINSRLGRQPIRDNFCLFCHDKASCFWVHNIVFN